MTEDSNWCWSMPLLLRTPGLGHHDGDEQFDDGDHHGDEEIDSVDDHTDCDGNPVMVMIVDDDPAP